MMETLSVNGSLINDEDFGRIAAQSFKQMMTTKVRDAKRATVLDAYIGREES